MMPENYTLSGLYKTVQDETTDERRQKGLTKTLQFLVSQLSNTKNLQRESDDLESIEKLSLWTLKAILPDNSCVSYDDPLEDEPPASRVEALALIKKNATHGLNALTVLFSLTPLPTMLKPEILISLTAFTNPLDAWSTPVTLSLATALLSTHTHQTQNSDFIATYLLQNFIRPLFLKSKKIESITVSGRKAMPTSAPTKRFDAAELDHANQPWRYEIVYAITVFGWAIENTAPTSLPPSLPLFLPPLLHLLDTTSTPLRHRGLLLLPTFLNKLTSSLLASTGLASVFEDALHPILLSVPSLTPTIEAELLLPAAYEALFALCDVWFPPPNPTTAASKSRELQLKSPSQTKETEEREKKEKLKIAFLTRVFRKGILPAHQYTHPTYPSITTILLTQLSVLIPRLGIHTVRHLKDIMPLITDVLVDPFAMARVELVRAALSAEREVLLNCWPRFASGDGVWRMEVLKGMAACWGSVQKQDDEDEGDSRGGVREVKKEMNVVGRLLVKAVEAGDVGSATAFKADIKRLIEVDKRIAEVFGLDE